MKDNIFEIGEKVTIKENLNEENLYKNNAGVVSGMKQYKGKETQIKKIEKKIGFKDDRIYKTNIDNGKFWWSADILEKSSRIRLK